MSTGRGDAAENPDDPGVGRPVGASSGGQGVERPDELTEEEEADLDAVWDRIGAEEKGDAPE